MISYLQRYFLKRAVQEAVQQGNQFAGIEGIFGLVQQEAQRVYTEDNVATLNGFLRERLEAILPKVPA